MNPCGGGLPSPQISAEGVTNGASFLPGPVAPGEIVVISGSGFGPAAPVMFQLTPDEQYITTSLAATRVLFDGTPAPVLFASTNQVSVIVPFATAGRNSISMQVEYNGALSNRVTCPLAPVPRVFSPSIHSGRVTFSMRIRARTERSTPLRKARSLLSTQRAQDRPSREATMAGSLVLTPRRRYLR